MTEDCAMCKARSEERLIRETEHSFSVLCKNPLNESHLLILPKRHVTYLGDLSKEEAKDILDLISFLKNKFLENYGDHPTLHMNFGTHSSQSHLHFHLLSSKKGFRELVSSDEGISKYPEYSEEDMVSFSDKIKGFL